MAINSQADDVIKVIRLLQLINFLYSEDFREFPAQMQTSADMGSFSEFET
jgi:hypothetical protein